MWLKLIKAQSQIQPDLLGYVIGNFEESMGCGTLGVHNSLGDSLTGEVSELVEEMEVLSEDGATGTSGHRVLVVIDGSTRAGGDNGTLVGHAVEFFVESVKNLN